MTLLRASCSRSGAGLSHRAPHVAQGVVCGSQAARRASRRRVSCNVALSGGPGVAGASGGVQRVQLPSFSNYDDEMMNEIRRMAENNEDDALLEYLETWMLSLMVEDDLEIASLKKKLAITSDRLQQITAVNLHALGRFNLRGLLEHTQQSMYIIARVAWDDADPVACWDEYIAERPALKECLVKHNVNVEEAGVLLSTMYRTLSESPAERQTAGSTLRIGPPLDQEQQKVMACICKDAGVRYEFVPDLTTDAKV